MSWTIADEAPTHPGLGPLGPLGALQQKGRIQRSMLSLVHRACDSGHLDLAATLLKLAETLTEAEPDIRQRRRDAAVIVAAYERLWRLRNPENK